MSIADIRHEYRHATLTEDDVLEMGLNALQLKDRILQSRSASAGSARPIATAEAVDVILNVDAHNRILFGKTQRNQTRATAAVENFLAFYFAVERCF